MPRHPLSSTARGAISNFKLVRGYRHTICASVNEQVVHGIPCVARARARRHRLDRRRRGAARLERRLGLHRRRARPVAPRGRRRARRAVRASPRGRCGPGSPRWRPPRTSARSAAPCRTTSSRRGTATASCATMSGTASAARCTSLRRCSTTASPRRARRCGPGSCVAIEPMVVDRRPGDLHRGRRLDRVDHRRHRGLPLGT